MEEDNTSTLLAALKLDETPLINQFMFVEEINNADGSFIISSVLKEQIKRNQTVILVLCHNSIGHFHSIGLKLNYNLLSLKEAGKVIVIEILEKVVNGNFYNTKGTIKNLYLSLKQQIDEWDRTKGVCVIVENMGNLLFVDIKETFALIGYLRASVFERANSSFICSFHNFTACPDFNIFAKSVKHFADVTVVLNDLQTGRANDVTGHLTVIRRNENYSKDVLEYQYQIQDKSVFVFAPGLRNIL